MIYENPEKFNPERFSMEHPKQFLPFGDGEIFFYLNVEYNVTCYSVFVCSFLGPRQCIGLKFAKLLIGVGLVSLLRNFKFSTCERTQIPIQYSKTKNTLIPSDGVWLNVHQI